MAHIHNEEVTISLSQLVKDGETGVILTDDIREAIAMLITPTIEEVVGAGVVVEVK
jgi:hypothetical protein